MNERRKTPTDPAIDAKKMERRMGDRRDSHRIPIEVEVREGNGPYELHNGNISIGGMFFEKPLSLPIGAVVKLRFMLPDMERHLEVQGEVVEITAVGTVREIGTRVRFFDLDTRSELLIARFLDQHPEH